MAIYDYSLTAQDVLDKISLDTRRVQQSSGRVSRDDIDGWIDECASEFSGVLNKAGLDGSDLKDEAESQIQRGILAGAAAQTLQAWGHTGDEYETYQSTYEDLLDRYEADAQRLDKTVETYDSTVDRDVDDSPYLGANTFEM